MRIIALFRNLPFIRKFFVVFSFLFIAVMSSYAILFFYYDGHVRTTSLLVNTAGKNRMLSQRIAALTLLIKTSNNAHQKHEAFRKLEEAIDLHEESLKLMKVGGWIRDNDEDIKLPPAPENIRMKIEKTEEIFADYKNIALSFVNESGSGRSVHDEENSTEKSYTRLQDIYLSDKLLNHNDGLASAYITVLDQKTNTFLMLFGAFGMLNLTLIITSFYLLRDSIAQIPAINKAILTLSSGLIPESLLVDNKDEIGEIKSSVNELSKQFKSVTSFCKKIGEGDFEESDLKLFNNQGEFAGALYWMRDSLKKLSDDNTKRSKINENLASFSGILRQHKDLKLLGAEILSHLSNCISLNLAVLYIRSENKDELESLACYAYSRHKYWSTSIKVGEGLVGAVFYEKEKVYVKDIPDNYVKITSGLGNAKPKYLLVLPLLLNDEVFGVLEIASFYEFKDFELEFLDKLCENIASALKTIKNNIQTEKLLAESQWQAEELKAQEEEMRQNMEELAATQEDLKRKDLEMQEEYDKLRLAFNLKIEEIETHKQSFESQNTLLKEVLTVDSVLLDVAGRNRMLSQRIALLCELFVKGVISDNIPLIQAIEMHHQSLLAIKQGGIAPGIDQAKEFPPASQELLVIIHKVEALWDKYRHHALFLAENKELLLEKDYVESLKFVESNVENMLQLNKELVQKIYSSNFQKLGKIGGVKEREIILN